MQNVLSLLKFGLSNNIFITLTVLWNQFGYTIILCNTLRNNSDVLYPNLILLVVLNVFGLFARSYYPSKLIGFCRSRDFPRFVSKEKRIGGTLPGLSNKNTRIAANTQQYLCNIFLSFKHKKPKRTAAVLVFIL